MSRVLQLRIRIQWRKIRGQTYVTASREPHRWAITSDYLNRGLSSPHIMESKKVLDSGQHAVDSGFQALDFSLSQQNLDSGFQSLVGSGFLEIYSGFQSPRFRIPHKKRSCIPYMGRLSVTETVAVNRELNLRQKCAIVHSC